MNGRPERIGYLGSLRLLTGHRNRGLVARGYRFFRELHGDQRSPLYLTTIAAGNNAVIRLLTSGRAGLPAYHHVGDYCTLAIPLARRRIRAVVPSGVTIRPAAADDLATILTFLADQGPRRQFFPCYAAEDFSRRPERCEIFAQPIYSSRFATNKSSARLRLGISTASGRAWFTVTAVLCAGADLCTTVGLAFADCPGFRARDPFRYLTGALPVVKDDDPAVFHALLDALVRHSADTDAQYLLLGLHESDPLLPTAKPTVQPATLLNCTWFAGTTANRFVRGSIAVYPTWNWAACSEGLADIGN